MRATSANALSVYPLDEGEQEMHEQDAQVWGVHSLGNEPWLMLQVCSTKEEMVAQERSAPSQNMVNWGRVGCSLNQEKDKVD